MFLLVVIMSLKTIKPSSLAQPAAGLYHASIKHLLYTYVSQGHNACVTEHEKYALGATKPGGFAANGFADGAVGGGPANGGASQAAAGSSSAGVAPARGLEYLSTRPPWRCT